MLGAFLFLNETQPFPGWLAAIPTLGCALVIANPRSLPGEVALGNRVAGFFGAISYPLYLWHWPLFAFARIWPGVIPTTPVLLALAGVAVLLAALTYRLIEQPMAAAFRRRPFATALVLVGLLALTGIRRQADLRREGLSVPLPAAGGPHLRLRRQRRRGRAAACAASISATRRAIRSTRSASGRRASSRLITARRSQDPRKPTILIVGDSHAAHLFAGLQEVYGAQGQSPDALFGLLRAAGRERRDGSRRGGHAALPRDQRLRVRRDPDDQAGRADRRRLLRPVRPRGELALSRLSRRAGRRRAAPARATACARSSSQARFRPGPRFCPSLSAATCSSTARRRSSRASASGPNSLETDRALAGKDWGEGVRYVSQAAKLCGAEGCRRLIGENLPRICWPSTTAITASKAQSSPSEPSSRQSWTRNWRGSERIDATPPATASGST